MNNKTLCNFSGGLGAKKAESKPTATRHDVFVEKLSAIPQIADKCGTLFKSSQPVELTGSYCSATFYMNLTEKSSKIIQIFSPYYA